MSEPVLGPTTIVVSAPIYSNDTRRDSFRAPLGHEEQYRRVRRTVSDPQALFQELVKEHGIILFTLREMGIDFRVAWGHPELVNPGTREHFERSGFSFVEFPPSIAADVLIYPRDLAVQLPGNLALVDADQRDLELPESVDGQRIVKSLYGQGGRLHTRRDVALVTERYYVDGRLTVFGERPPIEPLEEAKLRVGLLPTPVKFATVGSQSGYEPEIHLDRFSGLLEGRDGQLHLVVDPKLHSGFDGIFHPPTDGPRKTIPAYWRQCDALGIEMHVPRKLSVPGSLGFLQFADGRVLMTGGDDEVARVVEDIVGGEKLFVTEWPIRCYPAWNFAGIRCLIGELPSFLCQLCVPLPAQGTP